MSLRSPLGRVLGLGSAKGGTSHWWMARVTSVALLPLGLWFVVALYTVGVRDYYAVLRFVHRPFNAVLLSLLLAVAAWHSSLGVAEVIEDYVPQSGRKAAALVLFQFAHVIFAVAGIYALLRLSLGGLP